MKKLNIDHEFKMLIPSLAGEEYDLLASSLKEEGCRDSIIVWNDTIIDGHNRYKICTNNKIPFSTREIDFESREHAIEWIIKNQFGRRNLPNVARVKLALRLKETIQERARKNQEGFKGNQYESGKSQLVGKDHTPIHTNKELGKLAGVSEEIIRRYETIQEKAEPEVKEKVDKGEMSISKGFKSTVHKEPEKVKSETRTCTVCGKVKPLEDFSSRNNECKKCQTERSGAGLTAKEARELNEQFPDDELMRHYEEMKNPTPALTDDGNVRNNISSIITDLDETLKLFRNRINKYVYMGNQKPSTETESLVDSLINDLNKINSNIKG